MTEQSGGGPPPDRARFVEHALRIFDAAALELGEALKRLQETGAEGSEQALRAVRDLQAAMAVLVDERVKVDRLRNEIAGVVGERALDLDAARAEIGRRLARLRDAGGGD